MTKHVFISHSHKDSAVANAVVAALEQRGVPCWVAPRNVPPGGSYAESILTAIETASCFVLIYSEHSNVSSHVLREVERALNFGVNIIPVRFDDSRPSKSLDYLLATVHWLAIPAESRERSIVKAAEQIAEWLKSYLANPAAPLPVRVSPLQAAVSTSLEPPRRRRGTLIAAAMLVVLAAAGAFATGRIPFLNNHQGNEAVNSNTKSPTVPSLVESTTAANRDAAAKVNAPLGYAGVNRPLAGPGTARTDHNNNVANLPRPTLARQRMENPNGTNPPPPPPAGQPISQFGNEPGVGAPPEGGYPPPPPPPPPGRRRFGPPNGPGPGMPPNGGEPRP